MAAPVALQDLNRLLPFVQAVRGGSFASAASALNVTPPAISKSVARLEAELGVRLFNRTTRRLQLTPDGRDFYDSVLHAMGELDQAVAMLRDAAHEPKGVVRVWVTATFGRYGLMPTLADFYERHPAVQLEMCFDEAPPDLVTEGYDLVIQQGRAQGKSQVARLLCHYPVVLVAGPAYVARRGTPRHPADLARHDCISVQIGAISPPWTLLRNSDPAASAATLPERHVHVPTGPMTVSGQRGASLMAALHGIGIAPCAELVAAPYISSGQLDRVLPQYRVQGGPAGTTSIYIHMSHRRHVPVKVRVFLDFLYHRFGPNGSSA